MKTNQEIALHVFAQIISIEEPPDKIVLTEYMCEAQHFEVEQEADTLFLDKREINLYLARLLETEKIETIFVAIIPEEFADWREENQLPNTRDTRAQYAHEIAEIETFDL